MHIDLTSIADAAVGDEVVIIIGRQRSSRIAPEEAVRNQNAAWVSDLALEVRARDHSADLYRSTRLIRCRGRPHRRPHPDVPRIARERDGDVQSGRIQLIATGGAKRNPQVPDIPTIGETHP